MERTSFVAEFAGIPIEISCPSAEVRTFCADYITERRAFFSVCVSADDIAAEAARVRGAEGGTAGVGLLCELSALHRKLAEAMALYGRFLMHGAAITYGGGAYLFCAPSGVGKSTHISLWRRFLGSDVDIINGDKPFLSLEGVQAQNQDSAGGPDSALSAMSAGAADGGRAGACESAAAETCGQPGSFIRVHGSPWAGKERWQKNRSAVLRAICLITRGEENSIRRIGGPGTSGGTGTPGAGECLAALMRQIYIPRGAEAAQATLGLVDALVRLVPVYQLRCDVSEEAVRCSFEALTGLGYEAEKSKAGMQKNG